MKSRKLLRRSVATMVRLTPPALPVERIRNDPVLGSIMLVSGAAVAQADAPGAGRGATVKLSLELRRTFVVV